MQSLLTYITGFMVFFQSIRCGLETCVGLKSQFSWGMQFNKHGIPYMIQPEVTSQTAQLTTEQRWKNLHSYDHWSRN